MLRPAANLPNSLVLGVPILGKPIQQFDDDSPELVVDGSARFVVEVDAVDQLAVDVELQLAGSTVANANGLRIPIAREVIEFELLEFVSPVDAVHDLQRPRIGRVLLQSAFLEERHELAGLLHESKLEEREEREGRVANPGVAVVPVTATTNRFRERHRRRSDNRTGRPIAEQFQDQG